MHFTEFTQINYLLQIILPTNIIVMQLGKKNTLKTFLKRLGLTVIQMIYGIFENTLQHVYYNLRVIVNITDEYMHTERNELKSIHCTMIAILFATEVFK